MEITPVETEYAGFMGIAEFPSIAVNKHGNVLSTISGKIIRGYVTNSGYVVVTARSKFSGKNKHLKVHRLVGFLFLPSAGKNRNIINHKNGIKDDNRWENLEWCTSAENNYHANIHLGYRTVIGVEVKCLESGKCSGYSSAAAASRNIDATAVGIRDAIGRDGKLKGRYIVRYKGNNSLYKGWPDFKFDPGRPSGFCYRSHAVVAKNIETGITSIYESITAAAKDLGYTPSVLFKYITRGYKHIHIRHVFISMSEYSNFPSINEYIDATLKFKYPNGDRPIRFKCVDFPYTSGITTVNKLSKLLGVTNAKINHCLRISDNKVIKNHMLMEIWDNM